MNTLYLAKNSKHFNSNRHSSYKHCRGKTSLIDSLNMNTRMPDDKHSFLTKTLQEKHGEATAVNAMKELCVEKRDRYLVSTATARMDLYNSKCNGCNKSFKTKAFLEMHQDRSGCSSPAPVMKSTVHGVCSDIRSSCDMCNRVFENQQKLQTHKKHCDPFHDGIVMPDTPKKVRKQVQECYQF